MYNFFKQLGLAICMICLIILAFATQDGLAASAKKSRFAKIDDKPVAHAVMDAKVVGVVVKKDKNATGKNVLYGFTSMGKFHQYLSTHQQAKLNARDPGLAYFFWHINTRGENFKVRVGYRVNYVGNTWNDQISSIVPACNGNWTVIYQHRDFRGEGLAFQNSNSSCRYYYNLTDFRMSNGQSWNDQTSSIRVY